MKIYPKSDGRNQSVVAFFKKINANKYCFFKQKIIQLLILTGNANLIVHNDENYAENFTHHKILLSKC